VSAEREVLSTFCPKTINDSLENFFANTVTSSAADASNYATGYFPGDVKKTPTQHPAKHVQKEGSANEHSSGARTANVLTILKDARMKLTNDGHQPTRESTPGKTTNQASGITSELPVTRP
jgi:hypothetical protein